MGKSDKKKRVLSEWDNLVKSVKGRHSQRFNSLLETMPDEEFVTIYPRVLEFFVPKLQRVEDDSNQNEDNKIVIVHVTSSDENKEDNA